MPTYNYKARELIAKIVYYGPGRCGKTTNLQQIHAKMRPETRSELLSVATETDRTIYFDLLPLNLGTISGMRFMVRLFTVPGQVYYSETRKLVLRGADGIVFVADSQDHMMDENRESLQDLKTNLAANGLDYSQIPIVLQYNKRDLPRLIPEAELDSALNDRNVRAFPAVASDGKGVVETLRAITVGVFNQIKDSARAAGHITGETSTRDLTPAPGTPIPHSLRPPTPQPRSPSGSLGGALDAARARARDAARGVQPPPVDLGRAGMPPTQNSAPQPAPLPPPPPPARISTEFYIEELRNLASFHAQMSERLSRVEQELQRVARENQEIKEFLTRQPYQR